MAYATVDDVKAALLWWDDADSQIPDSYIANTAIPEAEAVVEGHLRTQGYPTPITDEDDIVVLKGVVVALTASKLTVIGQDRKDEWAAIAQARLDDISSGRLSLRTEAARIFSV